MARGWGVEQPAGWPEWVVVWLSHSCAKHLLGLRLRSQCNSGVCDYLLRATGAWATQVMNRESVSGSVEQIKVDLLPDRPYGSHDVKREGNGQNVACCWETEIPKARSRPKDKDLVRSCWWLLAHKSPRIKSISLKGIVSLENPHTWQMRFWECIISKTFFGPKIMPKGKREASVPEGASSQGCP